MIDNIEIKYNEKLSKYSSIKIGGFAKVMAFPKNKKELVGVIEQAKRRGQKIFILGNGSNTLFDDDGFDGVVVNMEKLNKIRFYKHSVYVEAGVRLFYLNIKLQENGFSGIEWSYGIPGSVGGILKINGGAFGHEIFEFVDYVDVLSDKGIVRLKKKDIEFGYRKTDIDGCIVGCKLVLKTNDKEEIFKKMQDNLQKKASLQPYDRLSLGSVFKHTIKDGEVVFPAKLIDSMGLKGVKIGGVEISKKHAGFFVSDGTATSRDYLALAKFVEEKFRQKGIDIEREFVFLKK